MKKNTLIVALDRPSSTEAGIVLNKMPESVEWFKVGLELFTADGPAALALLKAKKKNIFLDLKLHDIPNTVARAVRAAAAREVSLLTIHALGGEAMMRAAAEAAKEIDTKAHPGPARAPKIIAVTVLTSHSREDLARIGILRPVSEEVFALAELALKSGVDGLVASVNEAQALREKFGQDFILIVPGIRPAGAGKGDQKRTATPAAAVKAGADYLVVGRPIIDAQDPRAAAMAIMEEMAEGSSQESLTGARA